MRQHASGRWAVLILLGMLIMSLSFRSQAGQLLTGLADVLGPLILRVLLHTRHTEPSSCIYMLERCGAACVFSGRSGQVNCTTSKPQGIIHWLLYAQSHQLYAGTDAGPQNLSLEAAYSSALAGTEDTIKSGSTDASVRTTYLLKVQPSRCQMSSGVVSVSSR